MSSKSKSSQSLQSQSIFDMSISCLTSNDYSVFRAELFNLFIWTVVFVIIYLLFHEQPHLFTDPSNDLWSNIISFWPYDIRQLYILLNILFSAVPFAAVCVYYDIIYKYKLFQSYRICEVYNKYPAEAMVSATIWYDLKLMFFYVPMTSFFTFNVNNNFDPIPNLWIICSKLLAAIYTFDILFYLTHRMLHIPLLYKYHKLHHEYKTTISWAATYSTIFELLVGNLPATAIPIVLFNLHPVTVMLYYMYRNIETTVSHSGYDLPFYISPLFVFKHLPGHYEQERFHDFHHSHNDGAYGFYFIDSMFGTNLKFRKYWFSKKFQ